MFNDPDRLISSTKRIGKNVEMSAHEKGGGLTRFEFKVINSFPDVGENGIIYLIQNSDGDSAYDEYVWIASESRFEKLGPRQIDIRFGTTEYEDGVTDLPTGALYFQYEV